MKKLFFIVLFATQLLFANNLNISNVTKVGDNSLSFDVSWDNSWWVSTYRDASWVFIKYKNSSGQWQHLDLSSATVSGFTLYTFPDNKGIMLSRAFSGTGTVTGTVTVNFNGGVLGPLPDFKVFGVEMVYINQGAFYVGDGASSSRFYQGNDNTLPYHVINSNLITVGNTSTDLAGSFIFSDIPASYPNGYDAFYTMKYEITNEQYAEYLNTLSFTQQQVRTASDISAITSSNRFVMENNSTALYRNSIACNANTTGTNPINFYCDANNNEIPNELNDGQNIACLYLSANDCLTYLDWAAMRPMTDMEFEKAARGENVFPIVGGDYANGTNIATIKGNRTNSNTASESVDNVGSNGLMNYNNNTGAFILRVGAFATSTSSRLQSGASFYGVMELSGNLNEITVRTTNLSGSNNLSFTNNYGDGILDANGINNEWNNISIFNVSGGHYFNFSAGLKISLRGNNISFSNFNNRHRTTFSSNPRGCR